MTSKTPQSNQPSAPRAAAGDSLMGLDDIVYQRLLR